MFELERNPALKIQELVHIAQILLAKLAIVRKSNLPLTPSYIIRKISINRVISFLDFSLCWHLISFKIGFLECLSEFDKANFS